MPLKLVVVRTTSWREGVLLGRPRELPDRSVFTPVSTLYLKVLKDALAHLGPYQTLTNEGLVH